jgi:hypothetical protein
MKEKIDNFQFLIETETFKLNQIFARSQFLQRKIIKLKDLVFFYSDSLVHGGAAHSYYTPVVNSTNYEMITERI